MYKAEKLLGFESNVNDSGYELWLNIKDQRGSQPLKIQLKILERRLISTLRSLMYTMAHAVYRKQSGRE